MVHDHNLICHGHGFDLIMRHINRGDLEALMQILDFGTHLHAELGVKIGQGLIKQEHLRVAHNGAPHRHTLALAARKLAREAMQ